MKRILKMVGLLLLTGGALIIAILCEVQEIPVGSTLGNLAAGVVIPYLLMSIVDLTDDEDWKSSQRKLKRAGILQKDTLVRISFAYLFRIKIDGQYFLVQNKRSKKYQPVGGAYKYYQLEADYFRDNIPIENDDRIPVDNVTDGDYRLLVKNKDLKKFVKRFNKTKYRENISNLSREFNEELFVTEILDKDTFGALEYKYCGRHMTKVESTVFQRYELLLADVVDIKLSENQKEMFKVLMEKNDSRYCFANAEQIKACGIRCGTNDLQDNIANHTFKILSENADSLRMKNKYKKQIIIDKHMFE